MLFSLVFAAFAFSGVLGHGYLKVPPARNCMWRYGFKNPPNYNDNEQFCGGATIQKRNGGRCGVCGDVYGSKSQPHMDGGRYGNRIIGRTYKQGQVIKIEVLLTQSHLGHFEFRIGDFSNSDTAGRPDGKLRGELLSLVGGGTKFKVDHAGKWLYKIELRLPQKLTCERCVLQWWYRGGNNWGCGKGGCGMGKGAQEHFVNCADVNITE